MPNRGGINRRTGKTTPRNKVKTHWGAKRRKGAHKAAAKPGKSGATSPSKAKSAAR